MPPPPDRDSEVVLRAGVFWSSEVILQRDVVVTTGAQVNILVRIYKEQHDTFSIVEPGTAPVRAGMVLARMRVVCYG